MLMFWEDESTEVTAAGSMARLTAIKSWVDDTRRQGVRLHGSSLRSARDAKFVAVRNDTTLVTDGPFAETKEQIVGYDVLSCQDLAAAVNVAAAHTLAKTGKVEVRPLGSFPGDA